MAGNRRDAQPHPLQRQWDSAWRQTKAQVRAMLAQGSLTRGDPLVLVRYGFAAGWRCAWRTQEERRERAYEGLEAPDKAGHKDIARARGSPLPSDRFLEQMANAAKAKRAGLVRGETLSHDAKDRHAKIKEKLAETDRKLRQSNRALSKTRRAQIIAKPHGISYRTVLRILAV